MCGMFPRSQDVAPLKHLDSAFYRCSLQRFHVLSNVAPLKPE